MNFLSIILWMKYIIEKPVEQNIDHAHVFKKFIQHYIFKKYNS
jgi:hypothetical protein